MELPPAGDGFGAFFPRVGAASPSAGFEVSGMRSRWPGRIMPCAGMSLAAMSSETLTPCRVARDHTESPGATVTCPACCWATWTVCGVAGAAWAAPMVPSAVSAVRAATDP